MREPESRLIFAHRLSHNEPQAAADNTGAFIVSLRFAAAHIHAAATRADFTFQQNSPISSGISSLPERTRLLSMITQFALRLICGLSVMWCVMPRQQVTSGFFRIQMLVTMGLGVLAAMAAGQSPATLGGQPAAFSMDIVRIVSGVLAAGSFVGSILWTLERRAAGARYAFGIAALSALTVSLSCVATVQLPTLIGTLYWLSELSTGLVSGSAVGSMLLGHWYLTTPTMSISPLSRVNVLLGIAAVARLVLAGAGLLLYSPWTTGDGGFDWKPIHSVWLCLEWLGGILGPLLVVWMVWRIMKYRNTQAATGVLFVGVILAFLGEMTGALLRRELNLPL